MRWKSADISEIRDTFVNVDWKHNEMKHVVATVRSFQLAFRATCNFRGMEMFYNIMT